jgi:hypothetical protein
LCILCFQDVLCMLIRSKICTYIHTCINMYIFKIAIKRKNCSCYSFRHLRHVLGWWKRTNKTFLLFSLFRFTTSASKVRSRRKENILEAMFYWRAVCHAARVSIWDHLCFFSWKVFFHKISPLSSVSILSFFFL